MKYRSVAFELTMQAHAEHLYERSLKRKSTKAELIYREILWTEIEELGQFIKTQMAANRLYEESLLNASTREGAEQ